LPKRQQQKTTIVGVIDEGFLWWLARRGFLHQQIKIMGIVVLLLILACSFLQWFNFDLPKVTNWLDLFRHFMDSAYTYVGLCFQTDDFWMTSRRGRR